MPRKASHCAITPLLPRQVGQRFLAIVIPGPGMVMVSPAPLSVPAFFLPVGRKPAQAAAKPTFSPTVQHLPGLQGGLCSSPTHSQWKVYWLPLPKLYVFQFISPCFLCMWCVWFYTSVWDLPAPYLSPKVPPLNAANHQLISTYLISSSRHTPPLFCLLFPLATMPVANAGFLPPEYSLAELSLRCANISNKW